MSKMSRQEMTEKRFGAVHRINLDAADQREPACTLAETLSRKNITALRKLGRLYKVSGFSKMDKPAIVPALMERMTDPDVLAGHLLVLEKDEWALFKRAAQAGQVAGDALPSANCRFLLELGLMALHDYDGHFRYVVPREIQEAYLEVEKTGFPAEKEHGDLLNDYAIAAANLYGVIRQDDFVDLFNSQNERQTGIDEMFGALIRYVSMEYGYCFWEDYIVHDDFAENDFEDVEKLAKAAAAKPRYLPAKPDLLEYSKWGYMEETPSLRELREYISRMVSGNTDLTEEILREVHAFGNYEAEPQAYINILEDNGISLTSSQLKELLRLILELRNNTRLWRNNGHTPNELFAGERNRLRPLPKEPVRVVKTGRNEPCPCGSGKKYKKCCGR